MSALKEFLQSEAQKRHQRHADIEKKRSDWINAVGELTNQLKTWVDESNKDAQVLQTSLETVELAEEELGTYHVQSLVISLDPRTVRVKPVARNVVGGFDEHGIHIRADGRVDITNGARKYILYRIGTDKLWKVVNPENYHVCNFGQAEFESILQRLLS